MAPLREVSLCWCALLALVIMSEREYRYVVCGRGSWQNVGDQHGPLDRLLTARTQSGQQKANALPGAPWHVALEQSVERLCFCRQVRRRHGRGHGGALSQQPRAGGVCVCQYRNRHIVQYVNL